MILTETQPKETERIMNYYLDSNRTDGITFVSVNNEIFGVDGGGDTFYPADAGIEEPEASQFLPIDENAPKWAHIAAEDLR